MTLTEENISYIKKAFSAMKTKDDLLVLLNYVKRLHYEEKSQPFTIRQLNFFCNPNNETGRYTTFNLAKKSGDIRTIHAPVKGLKILQECLKTVFETIVDLNPAATGFVKGKSILYNATQHLGSRYVFNTDLKDFFPGIDQARIWGRIHFPPFNLEKDTERGELAKVIAGLCCHKTETEREGKDGTLTIESRSVLPQGAPTSPILSNIICQRLDYYLSAVAQRFQLEYTRYADDITFSGNYNIFGKGMPFNIELERIIKKENFRINTKKTRLQKIGYRQEVTGITVNEKPNVPKRYIKQLRMWLYYWETYGYDRASDYFLPQYIADKSHLAGNKSPNFSAIIRGKLDYLKMVKGAEDPTYEKLVKRYVALAGEKGYFKTLFTIWEQEGIKKAMEKYYENKTQ
ncbi:RNA-directed DNA polymerase [Chitinophaga ginsengisegetis]|uniref:reverse transcriptase family protein n=1 Tax=Chitinophaga ginsengisegetis TaxID=393003 RepID=UPI003437E626